MNAMLGAAETRRRFAEVLDRVVTGERVVVTRNGEPVAAIVPLPEEHGSDHGDAEARPLGLGAFAGAMAAWDDLGEIVGAAVTTRAVARDRVVPEIE